MDWIRTHARNNIETFIAIAVAAVFRTCTDIGPLCSRSLGAETRMLTNIK